MISIIIPAYNEGGVIGRTLARLLAEAEPGELDVVVVCNGCTDNTAEIARGFGEPVRVIETPIGSKTGALNLGDETAATFPRFYIDADIQVSIEALRRVAEVLRNGAALAAAPHMKVDLNDRNWFVRAYYNTWTRLPYHREGMLGAGIYAVSKEGRRRFDAFPDIIADDEFFRLQFTPEERACLRDVHFIMTPPKQLRKVVAINARSYKGGYQLKQRFPELQENERKSYAGPLGEISRDPRRWIPFLVYVCVNLLSRLLGYWRYRTGQLTHWERDESSRTFGCDSNEIATSHLATLPNCVRSLFGIPVAALTMAKVVDLCGDVIRGGGSLNIGVVNAAKIVNMGRNDLLDRAVLSSDLILADGMAVVWASRLLRRPLPERVAGIDLFLELIKLADRNSFSIYLLGATEEVVSRVASRIREEYPNARLAGYRNGYFDDSEFEAVSREIAQANPDILFLGITSPKKEIFMERCGRALRLPVVHGVGGSFDVMAGKVARAPAIWQRYGLEWLYRVYQEPRRMWRRYLVTNVLFVFRLVREMLFPTPLRVDSQRGFPATRVRE